MVTMNCFIPAKKGREKPVLTGTDCTKADRATSDAESYDELTKILRLKPIGSTMEQIVRLTLVIHDSIGTNCTYI